MAQIDDVLAELRQRIMGPVERGSPKPTQPQHQETNGEGPAMTQPSAAVALRRLAHPGRDGVVVGDAPASEPINPERDDPLSPLIKRLSRDMPELMEEVVAFIERQTAELNGDDGAAPRSAESVAPAVLAPATPTPQAEGAGKTAITLLFDTQVLARIDADAKRVGISRAAWLHVAADERLNARWPAS
jgi:hypothetical protein